MSTNPPPLPPARKRSSRRLLWRFARSYTLVTVLTILMVQYGFIAMAGCVYFLSPIFPASLAMSCQKTAPQFSKPLQASPLNFEALFVRLDRLREEAEGLAPVSANGLGFNLAPSPAQRVRLILADAEGRVLLVADGASNSAPAPLESQALPPHMRALLPPSGTPIITEPLAMSQGDGRTQISCLVPVPADPSKASEGVPVGFLGLEITTPFTWAGFMCDVFRDTWASSLGISILAGLIGPLFGFFASRRIIARFHAIANAAEGWRQGRFDSSAPEEPADELGQLGKSLNHTARELKGLLGLKQEIATLTERQRIARELHDTVKQQAFSCAMLLGAARQLQTSNPEGSVKRLEEASRLMQRMQRELSEILGQLKDGAASVRLLDLLEPCAHEWRRIHEIGLDLRASFNPIFPAPIAQEILRILQEALANIARHSRATLVEIALVPAPGEPDCLELVIKDNGCGFDPSSGSGSGLKNMRFRAEALEGGQLKISSGATLGTILRLKARLPKGSVL